MFAYIQGELVQKEATYVILDVQGVGYHIKVSLNTSSAIGEEKKCKLHTYLQVREDAHTLFGFWDLEEKKLFLDLISVSGIGTNTAMIMLSSLATADIQQAIISENIKVIQSIKGIGLKTAQRLVLELKDKIKKENIETLGVGKVSHTARIMVKNEAIEALMALGLPKTIADKNIETIIKQKGEDLKLEELIRFALKM